jgi:hypothetical protein
MESLSKLYVPLSGRAPIPFLYQPTAIALTLVPFLTTHRRVAIWTTSPILLYLCLSSPSYTFGDPSSDYYSSGPFLAILLWYLDFVILTPIEGPSVPVFHGLPQPARGAQQQVACKWADNKTFWQRLKWAFRLMLPSHRGIGWNWQVKGVPLDPYAELPKWRYVRVQMYWSAFAYLRSAVMLVVMGFSVALQEHRRQMGSLEYHITNAAIGWSGATWVWDRLNCFYCLAAAVSVALGICDTWEWPPLTGDIRDAWSVRQMWRYAHHFHPFSVLICHVQVPCTIKCYEG